MSANNQYPLPHDKTWKHASKLAIVEDKPIMYDWVASLEKRLLLALETTMKNAS